MPLIHTDLPPSHGPVVSIRPSVVIEIEWFLASAERQDFRQDHPVVAALYERHPDLLERARGIWEPGVEMSCGGFLELMVLAHHGGLLFSTDADQLVARLDELCTTAPGTAVEIPLHSEAAADRQAVFERLARLRRSAALRRRYVALVADAWQAMADEWNRAGRTSVEVAVAARRELEAKGADWHEVVRSDDCDFGDLLDTILDAVAPNPEIVVVPAYFTHKALVVDLPGVVVVGVRTDTTGAHARARTEALARRLKAISDPTRLAILDALRSGPRTTTEIAASFSLAQPTVSNHVKLLRDAGLVSDVRQGTRRNLVVHPDAVTDLIGHLQSVLSGPPPVDPAAPGAAVPGHLAPTP
ncbi:MAG: ArsR/SmtB family transcription factor [Acidimicrobiales bacterium]